MEKEVETFRNEVARLRGNRRRGAGPFAPAMRARADGRTDTRTRPTTSALYSGVKLRLFLRAMDALHRIGGVH